ncbi:MAG: polysaccharide deacetylase family protein [Christiangramia sp.]
MKLGIYNIIFSIFCVGYCYLALEYGWPVWLVFIFLLLYFLFILVVSTTIRFNFFLKGYHSQPSEKSRIALTFDDGPSEYTPEILELLKKHQVQAAFFCIGKQIEKYPEIFQQILEDGHIIGNHTFHHTRKIGFLSSEQIFREILACDEIVENKSGLKLKLFRPPFGIINPKTKRAIQRSGHLVMGWNVRPYDAITKSPEVIIKRITRKLKPGDVILLHDNQQKTVSILEQLLVILEKKNLGTLRPDKLFGIHAYR